MISFGLSTPIFGSKVRSSCGFLSSFPMLVAQVVPNGIDFGPCAQQRSVVPVGLKISEGNKENDAGHPHVLVHIFVGLCVTLPSLHEHDEVCHIVSHLRG